MKRAEEGRTHLYEVSNHGRRESLIVPCPDAPEDFARRLGPPRPPPIAHWGVEEKYVVDQLAESLAVEDADEFLTMYFATMQSRAWKQIAWRP